MAGKKYTFFLAHAGRDKGQAEKLYDLLAGDCATFLDSRDLSPGDDWDIEIPRAQRGAAMTVALISQPVDPAYYLREEIAAAIAYQREDPAQHRLVPVYLDGRPSDPEEIPYGMRVKHALDAAKIGLRGVAEELRTLALRVAPSAAPPATAATPAVAPATSSDAIALYDCLLRLLPAQFDAVLLYAQAPQQYLAPATAPLATRALDLTHWAQQGGPHGVEAVRAAVRRTGAPCR